MNFDELCKNVSSLSGVRFAGVLDRNGQLAAGGYKDGLEGHLDPNESGMSFYYASHGWESRKTLAHKVGKEKFAIIEFEKVKQVSVPLDNQNILLISVEPKIDHDEIIRSVFSLLSS